MKQSRQDKVDAAVAKVYERLGRFILQFYTDGTMERPRICGRCQEALLLLEDASKPFKQGQRVAWIDGGFLEDGGYRIVEGLVKFQKKYSGGWRVTVLPDNTEDDEDNYCTVNEYELFDNAADCAKFYAIYFDDIYLKVVKDYTKT